MFLKFILSNITFLLLFTSITNAGGCHSRERVAEEGRTREPVCFSKPRDAAPLLQEDCSICLGIMNDRNALKLRCGHYFHCDCIHEWFDHSEHKDCPMCRKPIRREDLKVKKRIFSRLSHFFRH